MSLSHNKAKVFWGQNAYELVTIILQKLVDFAQKFFVQISTLVSFSIKTNQN